MACKRAHLIQDVYKLQHLHTQTQGRKEGRTSLYVLETRKIQSKAGSPRQGPVYICICTERLENLHRSQDTMLMAEMKTTASLKPTPVIPDAARPRPPRVMRTATTEFLLGNSRHHLQLPVSFRLCQQRSSGPSSQPRTTPAQFGWAIPLKVTTVSPPQEGTVSQEHTDSCCYPGPHLAFLQGSAH